VIELMLGADDSNWKVGLLVNAVVLPALSVQVPVTVALCESGAEYVLEAHEAIPENELPAKVAVTGLVYQLPLIGETLFAVGSVTEVIDGVDASYWNVLLETTVVLPAASEQLPMTVPLVVSGPL
jgi:hypothetical protein